MEIYKQKACEINPDVNKGNVKKIILFMPAFGRKLKKEENGTHLELGQMSLIVPICGNSMIRYFWRINKPHEEVSPLLLHYMMMKAA
jgi:hypothetical protein